MFHDGKRIRAIAIRVCAGGPSICIEFDFLGSALDTLTGILVGEEKWRQAHTHIYVEDSLKLLRNHFAVIP